MFGVSMFEKSVVRSPLTVLAIFMLSGSSLGCSSLSMFGSDNQTGYVIERVPDVPHNLLEVERAATTFVVPFSEDYYATQRVLEFMQRYGRGQVERRRVAVDQELISDVKGVRESPFSYLVEKVQVSDGMRYSVTCLSDGAETLSARQAAVLNARNFARFIRLGKLEVSLLR